MNPVPDLSRRIAWCSVALIWLLWASITIAGRLSDIAALSFGDPDDALRFTQMRDWMAGQGWADLNQYRGSAMDANPMHWSRLVDVPIAAMLGLARLIFSQPVAERVAVTAVPLLLMLALMAIVFQLTRSVTLRRDMAVIAAGMLALSLAVTMQFKPLRIDHHAWQIVLGALAVLAIIGHRDRPIRQAVASGVAMAVSLVVAIEGLPLSVAIAGVLALDFVRGRADGRALTTYVATLFAGSALLSMLMLGPSGASVIWCDAMSPAYWLPMGAAALLIAGGAGFTRGSLAARVALLAVAGAAGVSVLLAVAPQCAAGPFAGLDPLVESVWYRNIPEGLPIWTQQPNLQLLIPLPSLLGFMGTILALRLAPPGRRAEWIDLLLLQAVAFAVSMMVLRALGIAHVLALPGCALLFVSAFRFARSLRWPSARVLLTAGSVAMTPIGAQGIASGLGDNRFAGAAAKQAEQRGACLSLEALRGLDSLPAATLFTPVDIGAHLLAYTHHSVIATGHHRNRNGMKAVISAFMAPPDRARAIITATPANYLALCATETEVDKYAQLNAASLAAMLLAGRHPAWLEPVPMRPGELIRVYRIIRDQAGTKSIATPFMQ